MRWQAWPGALQQGEQTARFDSLEAWWPRKSPARRCRCARCSAGCTETRQSVPGWQADLSGLPDGRLFAQRLMPLPTAELRLVLDR
jgi:outer membrane lipoprotein LolB